MRAVCDPQAILLCAGPQKVVRPTSPGVVLHTVDLLCDRRTYDEIPLLRSQVVRSFIYCLIIIAPLFGSPRGPGAGVVVCGLAGLAAPRVLP